MQTSKLLLLLLFCLLVSSCSKPNPANLTDARRKILGTWEAVEGKADVTYYENGHQLTQLGDADASSIEAFYRFLDDNQIEITIPKLNNRKITQRISYDGDDLIVTDSSDNKNYRFKRKKG